MITFDHAEQHPGARLLFILACLVIVVYGLRLAAPILLPSAFALFLAILGLPVMLGLRRRGLPAVLAITVTVGLVMAVFALLIVLAGQSLSTFQTQLPRYAVRLQGLEESWIRSLEVHTGLPVGNYLSLDLVNPAAVVELAGTAVGRVARFVSMTFLVFLIMIFMLGEAVGFPEKIRTILGDDPADRERMVKVVRETQTYLGIKTGISLATGLAVGAWAYVTGLDFPVLLGLVAFVLNYVPTVGSIIAAIPAILLSLVLYGSFAHVLLVTAGYVVVNVILGNILEPSLMGRRLGLSTLVVVLSLLFWGWAWGPVGALLSVPLTVFVKIWLENTRDLRWIAVLLDKRPGAGGSLEDGSAAGEAA